MVEWIIRNLDEDEGRNEISLVEEHGLIKIEEHTPDYSHAQQICFDYGEDTNFLIKCLIEANSDYVEELKRVLSHYVDLNISNPWNLPPLNKWSIVGMNHYYQDGERVLFCAMTYRTFCIKAEGKEDEVFKSLREQAIEFEKS